MNMNIKSRNYPVRTKKKQVKEKKKRSKTFKHVEHLISVSLVLEEKEGGAKKKFQK